MHQQFLYLLRLLGRIHNKNLLVVLDNQYQGTQQDDCLLLIHILVQIQTTNLDAHLELTLRSDAELIIERKIEEEVDDDLSLIFK